MQPARRPFDRALAKIAATLLPQDCVLCNGSTREFLVCEPCLQSIPRLPDKCPRCALPTFNGALCGACLHHPPHFDATFAACRYDFPLDRLIQAYKYDGALAMGALFAHLLGSVLDASSTVDLIVPLPLATKRLRERGFNQSHEIARRLGSRTGIDVDPTAAIRVRDTTVQAELPVGDRSRNVRNAFTATAAIMGRRIAVVDDVMTTGATLDEFARILKSHGALHVENWVVARALLDP
ncbi:MAG: ComF family protein [Betaproteobacteria bacterium]|nr:ComF family protein [Betaproteobacteria bacterium]